jgi:hypothetical protein
MISLIVILTLNFHFRRCDVATMMQQPFVNYFVIISIDRVVKKHPSMMFVSFWAGVSDSTEQ